MFKLLAYSFVLLFSALSIGGIVVLYLQRRTLVILQMLLFLLSLLLIAASFWFDVFRTLTIDSQTVLIDFLLWATLLGGSALNIFIVPAVISALTMTPMKPFFQHLHRLWFALFVLLGIAFYLLPKAAWIAWTLLAMQVTFITSSLFGLAILLRQKKHIWWYRDVHSFLYLSHAFVVLLILDVAITAFDIELLRFFDNLSLAIYLLIINAASLVFCYQQLNTGALVDSGRLTEACISLFELTDREREIVEGVISGAPNKVVANQLNISPKTVENNLTRIYQKTGVRNRAQLMQTFLNGSHI